MAVGAASGGWGGGGIVAALRAALAADMRGSQQESGGQKNQCGVAEKGHWKNASRAKSKIQKTPMVCQYHPVQSTRIWRVSSCRDR